jgi:hypothetical protein
MATDVWAAPLARYAHKVGLEQASFVDVSGAPKLPSTAILWRSTYAQLLVLSVARATAETLRAAADVGQEWLDASCMTQERAEKRVVDAYLLLILPDLLPETLFPLVQEIELDPTTCRKHVAWPMPGTDEEIVWRRLLRVTALGLPASPTASGMTNTPMLASNLQKLLLTDVKDLNGKPAARQHAEHSIAEPEP